MINWFNCQSTVPGSDTQNCWANQQSSPENPDVSHHLWPWSIIGGSFPFAIERKGLLSFAWRCVSAWARLQWSDYQWKSTTQNATGVYWQYAVITENPGFWLGISEGNRWAPKTHYTKMSFMANSQNLKSRSYSPYMSSLALHRLIMLQPSIGPSKMIVSCSYIYMAICSLNGRLREQAEIPRPPSSGCALISSYTLKLFGHGHEVSSPFRLYLESRSTNQYTLED